jgi:hypothetical protein
MRTGSREATLTLAPKPGRFQVFDDMTSTSEAELVAALRERLVIIADEESRRNPEAHMDRLREISERIEQISGALSTPVNPQLAHYLARHSYDKALEFLTTSSRAKPRDPL